MLFLLLFLALSAQIHSHPILFLRYLSFSRSDKSGWLFNWTFGWGESTVSVVDPSPPLTFSARPATSGAELEDPLLGYMTHSLHLPPPAHPRMLPMSMVMVTI